MKEVTNGYDLSRKWFNWCFENTDLITPNHSALYFFCIEHCNRLGWKEKFGLPTTMAKEAIGIRSYNTYINTLNDLVEWGFIKLIEKSKNQYSANIVALSKNNKADNKALDKAFIKHASKQSESTIQSTGESISSIDKPITINNKPLTIEERKSDFIASLIDFEKLYRKDLIKEFSEYWTETKIGGTKMKYEYEKTFEIQKRLVTWAKNEVKFNKPNNSNSSKASNGMAY